MAKPSRDAVGISGNRIKTKISHFYRIAIFGSHQTKPNSIKPNLSTPNQTRLNKPTTKPNQTPNKPNQILLKQSTYFLPNQTKEKLNHIQPNKTVLNQIEQNKKKINQSI